MSSGKLWTTNETAMVDAAIAAGLRAAQCTAMFCDRTGESLLWKFSERRKALGCPSRPGPPRKEPQAEECFPPEVYQPFESPAEIASGKLINATLGMYARKANREQCALEQAMLRTLYSPAQVEAYQRMAA